MKGGNIADEYFVSFQVDRAISIVTLMTSAARGIHIEETVANTRIVK